LRPDFDSQYVGVDVVEKLIAYCITQFPDYRVVASADFSIPSDVESADFVTAVSLFTHLLHEQTYLYIKDAYRVLRPAGKLILRF
jgi:hypothetical protein